MIIDTTQTRAERLLSEGVQWFEWGYAQRSYGWEYIVLSNDQETTGFPIEPIVRICYLGGAGFLIDNAGIIWVQRDKMFVRECKGSTLAYISTYLNSFLAKDADKLSSMQHSKWCLAAGESDEC